MIDPNIQSKGYFLTSLELPSGIRAQLIDRNWVELDLLIHNETLAQGIIYRELEKYADFSEIEHIISIRSSGLEADEDGIWHDDGSRVLAFSLSLTLDPLTIEGGCLEIRKKQTSPIGGELDTSRLPTPAYGTLIVFATGYLGFEHRIYRVTQGERIIIAGWCS